MDFLRLLLRKVRSRRGSPTVEYVFVMVAAAMLAGIVVGIVKSEPVQASLRQVILCSVPFLYDENGEPSCKVGKYMAKEDPEPEPPAEETNPLQLITKPDFESTPPVKPVKSDPPWYECALSWDCIKKKGGELKDHLLEKIRKEAIQHCGSDADCIRDYMEKRVGADIAGLLFPHLSSQSGKFGKFFGIDPWFEFFSFVMDHPTFSLAVVSTIIALFVSPPLGGTMLVSGAVSGGISWWEGNDLDTILRDAGIGGFAGVFGYGVFAGVSRYVGARLAQSTLSPFIQKWLPKIIGGGSGGVADQSAFDGLRDRKFDWRSATIAGMIGMLIPYAGAVIDGSPALGKQLQQMIPGVSGDGTLAMPWVKKNGQEAAEGYNKASGNGGGGTAKKKQSKSSILAQKVPKIQRARSDIGLNDVAKIREEMGLPSIENDVGKKKHTVAVVQADGNNMWGVSGHGRHRAIKQEWKINAQTPTHAEGDALFTLYEQRKSAGIIGGRAKIVVDRPLCKACGDYGGVRSAVEQIGLDELTVVTPDGTQIIRPRPGYKRDSW